MVESSEELIHLVRHLSTFPTSTLEEGLRNIFDFDAHKPDMLEKIIEVMEHYGCPLFMFALPKMNKFPDYLYLEWEYKVLVKLLKAKISSLFQRICPLVSQKKEYTTMKSIVVATLMPVVYMNFDAYTASLSDYA
jgi:reverse gyrase